MLQLLSCLPGSLDSFLHVLIDLLEHGLLHLQLLMHIVCEPPDIGNQLSNLPDPLIPVLCNLIPLIDLRPHPEIIPLLIFLLQPQLLLECPVGLILLGITSLKLENVGVLGSLLFGI